MSAENRAGRPRLGSLGASDDRPAVVEPHRGRVSYAELDRLAAAVAGRLRRLGLSPGARIGLHLRRSSDAIAAMLGALRAGCTYVPVDPRAPVERNAEIHADCGVALALVEERFAAGYREAARRLRATIDVQTIGAVGLGRAIGEWASDSRSEPAASPAELACILYTSGSTGRHKGWMMTRTAIEAHAGWCHRLLRPGRDTVFANHAEFSFGMSLFDIYASLTAGASLVLVPDEVRQFAAHIVELLSRERVTIWFSAPAILSLMAGVEDLESRDLDSLRVVAFAGEVFPAPRLNALRRRLPHPRYFNFYGSTETNVAAYYELPRDLDLDRPPPIGRPCEHYRARVVGPDGEPVAAGVTGELQLRGAGLTTGYVNQPALTAERIVPAADGGPPWYRTSDLVVELPGGDLRYVGRIGRMVKLRGYRVEPGEIELRLHEHPEVKEAGVVAVEGPNGLQLVAHLGAERLSVVELKRFCAAKLPPYMIPERFVFHAALPRTARGKIDFDGLRAKS
ncbi:MAG: amino acid adenylation domain-containing protein [Candidatus Binatia bacterium]